MRIRTRRGLFATIEGSTMKPGALIGIGLSALLVLAGCGPAGTATPSGASAPAGTASAASAPAGTASGASTPAEASATSSSTAAAQLAPEAADGANLDACADARCEVRAGPSAQIPLPASVRVEALRVESVGTDSVTLTGRYLGNHVAGGCYNNCDSSGSGGGFRLTLGPNGAATENGLSITLVAVAAGFAVLRLEPS